jgi:hypothetical protein
MIGIGIGDTVRWTGQQGSCGGTVRDITTPENCSTRVLWVDIDGGDLFPINEDEVEASVDDTIDIDNSGRGMDRYGSLE